MLLDIVILPPVKLRRQIGNRIRRLTDYYPRVFVVDNRKLIPHLSLWHLKTSKSRINILTKALEKIVKNQKAIKIEVVRLVAHKKLKGELEFRVNKNRTLSSLQRKVFKNIYPFRTGPMPSFRPFGVWRGKELKQARKYGRPLGFNPHFTMGLLKNMKDALAVAVEMKNIKFNFLAKEIYICEVNRWWQATKIIKKINFGR